jgi:hypothetical protein
LVNGVPSGPERHPAKEKRPVYERRDWPVKSAFCRLIPAHLFDKYREVSM